MEYPRTNVPPPPRPRVEKPPAVEGLAEGWGWIALTVAAIGLLVAAVAFGLHAWLISNEGESKRQTLERALVICGAAPTGLDDRGGYVVVSCQDGTIRIVWPR